MQYNLSEFLELLKMDLGIRDLPKPVTDQDLVNRIKLSALAEFNQRYPKQVTFMMTEDDRITNSPAYSYAGDGLNGNSRENTAMKYAIPYQYWEGSTIMGITNITQGRPNAYSDWYVPQGWYSDPITAISNIADIRLTASISSAMTPAMTFEFEKPNYIYIYNGWSSGIYTVRIRVAHDISLSTIPETAMTNFRLLCRYDLEAYLYNLLKRKNRIDTGVGSIELNIDDWSGSQEKFDELLRTWDEEGANLDIDDIFYF